MNLPARTIIIDSHQHFWRYDAVRYTWITEEMARLKRDFLPEDLAQECAANGVDGTISVQAEQSEAETEFLLQLAGENPRVVGVVGWTDLRSPRAEERLEQLSALKSKKLCGFRHIAQSEPDDRFLVSDDFARGVGMLRGFGFTYDILIYPRQLPAAIELASRFPEQKFVVDHLAKPEIKIGRVEPWATQIRVLAQNKNVFCKVSGMVTEADWLGWKPKDLYPYLDLVFEAFGADRLMFGSDWPVCLVAARYGRVKTMVEEYARKFSAEDRQKLFGENAIRFYGLKAALHGLTA